MLAVEIKGLVKTYSKINAVNNIDLKIPMGSIYGFLGPNGAGKTTTIKMLTGITKPTSGEIKIFGEKVHFGSNKNRKDIGFLPDVPNFYNWMRAKEYLRFSGKLLSVEPKELEERIDRLLEKTGLTGVNKKIGNYSRGMKQRLGIAQALIGNPRIIFLDEPTSALDPIGRKEVIDIILSLKNKVTVFFSTHILSDVEKVCDRVVILDKGNAIVEDTIENLKINYSHHIISLETLPGDIGQIETALSKLELVEKVEHSDNSTLFVHVKDLAKAGLEIPAIFNKHHIPLIGYSNVETSLEDIFLKVVNNK
ncbi:MAG: ABC transporter ATP-binding protein [Clostridia bacterium]|jgi:ABC-2 type transport system ATP-binding protein